MANERAEFPTVFPTPEKTSIQQSELFLNLDCIDEAALAAAYEACRKIIKEGSKTFYVGSLFLPYEKRRAVWAAYSFCRYTDDLVDKATEQTLEQTRQQLAEWESETECFFNNSRRPQLEHLLAWQHTCQSFNIPPAPAFDLIQGCRMDLGQNRYQTFEELWLYCYRVASTVGLMAAEIIGYRGGEETLKYAIDLGVAKQLTNILRDVGEDARNGRIYIPLDEMRQFGYTEEELLSGVINERWVKLMQFQIARARDIYQRAIPGIRHLHQDGQFSIYAASHLYSQILNVIERNGYDVFSRRAYVSTWGKLRGLLHVYRNKRRKDEG